MSLTFYYAPMSTASMTELVLEELGVPHEKIKLDLQKGETKQPEFLAVNPNGLVPCIVHDGVAIWESAALTIYLGETFGVERGLYPAPGPQRGEAMKWIVWSNVTLGEAVSRFTRNTMSWYPEDQRNAAAGEAAKADIAKHLAVLNLSLEGRQFLVGDYSVVDAHLCSFCSWVRHLKIDFTPFANIEAWSKRCNERPAMKQLMAAAGLGA